MPRSAIGFIVRALDIRRQSGKNAFTVMSLDNLSQNGTVIRDAVMDFADQIDPKLAQWISTNCCFPSTMVDRIVPATTQQMIQSLKDMTGIHDPALVIHEPFRQWVIEDTFVGGVRPDLSAVGAQFVRDVEPFEHMKLRMLNGTHSAMAYLGSLAGFGTVAEAAANPGMVSFLQKLWDREIIPSLKAPPETNLTQYAQALLDRYRNPNIHHLLAQIAMDGSQKIPQRILNPLFENHARSISHKGLMVVLAGWMRFLQIRSVDGKIDDPLAPEIQRIFQTSKGDAEQVGSSWNFPNIRTLSNRSDPG